MGSVISIKGVHEAPKSSQNKMETKILSVEEITAWKLPPCQRPVRVNPRVLAAVEKLKVTEQIEGVITLGQIKGDAASTYIIDGQHRLEAFKISGLTEVIADIRLLRLDSMAEVEEEFDILNSPLVPMKPDDKLRAKLLRTPAIAAICNSCDFVGFDQVRRNSNSPILSMSVVIRCWAGSAGETPAANAAGQSASTIAENMDAGNIQSLISFLLTAHAAWGRDAEYRRLWGQLNITVCMWLWRRLVMDRNRVGGKRHVVLTVAEFKQCLMALSADTDYVQWLVGRNLTERDRSPCWARIKSNFVRRLTDLYQGDRKKAVLPAPAWASK